MTTGELVQLYIYDLSGGLARAFSPMLLGKQVITVVVFIRTHIGSTCEVVRGGLW